jgi:hypothetical protein
VGNADARRLSSRARLDHRPQEARGGDPKGYDLRNSLSLRGGIATMLSPQVRGYISYGHSRSASRLLTNEEQISTGVNAGLSDRLSVGVFSTAGLSQGSPDIGAGIQLGMRIF